MTIFKHTSLALAATMVSTAAVASSFYIVTPSPGRVVGSEPVVPDIIVELAGGVLPKAKIKRPYTYDLKHHVHISGDPDLDATKVSFSATTTLPAGMSLQATGEFAGTPTVISAGDLIDVLASYKGKAGGQSFTLVVGEAALEAIYIAAAGGSTCAITPAGGVKCWGQNGRGQLGDGTTNYSSVPVDVVGLSSGVSAISVGSSHACAIQAGALKCWGQGSSGQLGHGLNTTTNPVPVQVVGLESSVVAVSAGDSSTCAIHAVWREAKCWGAGTNGRLGNGGTTASLTPVTVSGLESDVQAISSSYSHACAIQQGAVKCWGKNDRWQAGGGTGGANLLSPQLVPGLDANVTAIGTGLEHSCAVVAGTVKCWGNNGAAQLGAGTGVGISAPITIAGLAANPSQISVGLQHSCVLQSGALLCWGSGESGRLGMNVPEANSATPVSPGLSSQVTQISAGRNGSCAVERGYAKCWGQGIYGQLGAGEPAENTATPVFVYD